VLEDDPAGVESAGFLLLARMTLIAYRSLDLLWISPHDYGEEQYAPASYFWEASAYLAQLAAIYDRAGDSSGARFHAWMMSRDRLPYTRGLHILSNVAVGGREMPTARDLQCLATWSQMGSYDPIDADSSPGSRLSLLRDAYDKGLRWNPDDSFLELLGTWDSATEVDSLTGLRAASRPKIRGVADRLREMGADIQAFSVASALFDSFIAANDAAVQAFFAAPDAYVDPLSDLDHRATFPQPAMAAEYSGADPMSDLEADLFDVTPANRQPPISFETASSMYSLATQVDALFRKKIGPVESRVASLVLKGLGLTALKGFNWLA
jgi:hypothetical protein